MPYIRAWSEKYAASALVIIGVHTSEFDFEKDSRNVNAFVRDAKMNFIVERDFEIEFLDSPVEAFSFTFG